MIADEDVLLAVLNTAPMIGGVVSEQLDGADGVALARTYGGHGSDGELRYLRTVRDALHMLLHGDLQRDEAIAALQTVMDRVTMTPTVASQGVRWRLHSSGDDLLLAARVVHAWSVVNEALPGRLKACANAECNLFLVDHTRPGTAKWCSMATCGNRMKARAHADRVRRSR